MAKIHELENDAVHQSSKIRLILSWIWVGLPLAWGVSQTFAQSLALFK
jgi:hypothetical protein